MKRIPGAEKWCVPNSPAGARARTLVLDPANPARYWGGLEDLRLTDLLEVKRGLLKLERTASTFEATLTPPKEDKARRWHISADGRIWAD